MLALLKYSFALLVILAEGLCWLGLGIAQAAVLTLEAVHARQRLAGGGLHCDEGHPVSPEGTWECGDCHFRWQGLVWQCPNPACHAVTPWVACPVCRRSVRSPYVLEGLHGRPAS